MVDPYYTKLGLEVLGVVGRVGRLEDDKKTLLKEIEILRGFMTQKNKMKADREMHVQELLSVR